MPARNGLRRRLRILPVVALVTVALPAAPAAAQAPGLPRTFNVTRIDSPTPVGGGAFGWGVYSADLTGDGKQDLLVAQAQVGTATEPNKIFIFDGDTGANVDTIVPPENNPLEVPAGAPAGTPASVYRSPEMGFVYVETMPDIGSCPGGDGADPGRICDLSNIATGDGIPEILVGSRALRVDATDGTSATTTADRQVGRGYVIDGATRAVLKRIDMPVADRQQNLQFAGGPAFGRTISSPQGLPPCAGARAENNDAGVGACPSPSDPRYPTAVRIGDLDGGGKPDIVITARGFPESGDLLASPDGLAPAVAGTAAAGSQCRRNTRTLKNPSTVTAANPQTTAATCSAGKAWAYSGEAIAGSNPQTILETPIYSMSNPDAQTGGGEFGGNMWRVGDVAGSTAAAPATGAPDLRLPDGVPDFIVPARSHDLPVKNPDPDGGLNMGAAYLFSGVNGALIRTIVSPEPEIRSQFSGNFNAGRAVGDLGATTTPDILLPAAFQNVRFSDEGRLWAFNGDSTAGGGGEGSWNFAMLNDPEPYIGGNFGGGLTGVGDLVGGPGAPANEVLVGGFRFDNFTEASQNTVPDVNFMNVTLDRNLMTIPHPESGRGDGFGVGITPMGDLNGDGFLDFSVSAYFADSPLGGQGRAWIFKSDNSPPPPPPTNPAPTATGPTTPASQGNPLQPGRCANRAIGTDASERLEGTLAGDEIFGFAGHDRITGFAGQDCIDGGRGDERINGGDDNDRLIGGGGMDAIDGDDGRDELFGGFGNDRLEGRHGRDMIAGGVGNDRILGGPDADRLFGEAGKDRIIGGDGRNHIDGGAGNDSIESRNGERDRVVCGKGRDRVRADSIDRLNGCERVTIGRTGRANK